MKLIIYTYHYDGSIKDVVALGNSVRVFSSMESVIVVSPDIPSADMKELSRSFTRVVVSSDPLLHIVSDDSVDKAMVVKPGTIVTEKVDVLFSSPVPSGSPELSIMVIQPNRLLPKVASVGNDMVSVKKAYTNGGYTWRPLDPIYDKKVSSDVSTLMYENVYIPTKGRLVNHLKVMLGEILGERGKEAVIRELPTYALAFTHKSSNPVSNYDTLESYGDGFLKGAYMWVLSSTPGVVTEDQITKIADYYGSNAVLADIADSLGLTKYIVSKERINTKVKGDIVESLIGAIGFSWNRLYGTDEGVRMFVSHIYSKYTIDVANYRATYTSAIQMLNVYIQGLRIDRWNLSDEAEIGSDKITVKYLYGGEIVGVGTVVRVKGNIPDQVLSAKVKAASDVLDKQALDRFVGK